MAAPRLAPDLEIEEDGESRRTSSVNSLSDDMEQLAMVKKADALPATVSSRINLALLPFEVQLQIYEMVGFEDGTKQLFFAPTQERYRRWGLRRCADMTDQLSFAGKPPAPFVPPPFGGRRVPMPSIFAACKATHAVASDLLYRRPMSFSSSALLQQFLAMVGPANVSRMRDITIHMRRHNEHHHLPAVMDLLRPALPLNKLTLAFFQSEDKHCLYDSEDKELANLSDLYTHEHALIGLNEIEYPSLRGLYQELLKNAASVCDVLILEEVTLQLEGFPPDMVAVKKPCQHLVVCKGSDNIDHLLRMTLPVPVVDMFIPVQERGWAIHQLVGKQEQVNEARKLEKVREGAGREWLSRQPGLCRRLWS